MPILRLAVDDPVHLDDQDWKRLLEDSISESVIQLGYDYTLSHKNLTSFLLDMFLEKTRRPVNPANPTSTNKKQR